MSVKEWLSSKYQQYARVWRLLKKPTSEEFWNVSKISALGLLVIGAIGFLISLLITFISRAFA